MPVTCPYIVLNIRRNASPSMVRRAYRKLAKQHHPDANPGDPDAPARFKAVQEAYDLLSDPARRKRYDETGQTDVPEPKDVQELVACLSHFLQKAVQAAYNGPRKTDLVAKMKAVMVNELAQAEASLADAKKTRAEQADIMARFSTADGGENYLAGVVRQQVARCDAGIDALEKQIALLKTAHDYLKNARYRVDGAADKSGGVNDIMDALTGGMHRKLTWGVS